MRSEFKLSPVQMGYLFSSFLWTYAIFILPIGIMLDRFAARSINSIGIALWSIVMAATALVGSFTGLLIAPLIMGAGEATSISSCGRIVREWMPAHERGVANLFWSAGSFVARVSRASRCRPIAQLEPARSPSTVGTGVSDGLDIMCFFAKQNARIRTGLPPVPSALQARRAFTSTQKVK